MRAINPQGSEVTLRDFATGTSASNTINDATLVRLVATTAGVVNRRTAFGLNTVSCTVLTTEPTYMFKDPSDVLYSTSGVILATPITFMY